MLFQDRIIQIIQSSDTIHVYGLGESGSLYKLDTFVKKTWEMVQYPPMIEKKGSDKDGNKKGK